MFEDGLHHLNGVPLVLDVSSRSPRIKITLLGLMKQAINPCELKDTGRDSRVTSITSGRRM